MSNTRPYSISFFQNSRATGCETYTGSLDMAKAIAIATVEKGSADRVEIRYREQQLLFRYPALSESPSRPGARASLLLSKLRYQSTMDESRGAAVTLDEPIVTGEGARSFRGS